jgi:hypothetical protein
MENLFARKAGERSESEISLPVKKIGEVGRFGLYP